MSTEVITGNDLKAILNEVLPPTPSEYKKLLWENSSRTSAFASQTITLNLIDYDEIEVWFIHNTNADGSNLRNFITRTKVGENGALTIARNDSFLTQNREYNTTINGITFSDCVLGSSSTVYNNHSVPIRIYGIKYERIAPPQIELPTYSTEEQQIGTWIDGKPIYRKVYIPFEAKSYTSGSYTVTLDVPIGTIIRWDVLTTGNNNENQEVNKYIVPGRYSKTPNQISLECNTSSYVTNITYIILEYTKTTD